MHHCFLYSAHDPKNDPETVNSMFQDISAQKCLFQRTFSLLASSANCAALGSRLFCKQQITVSYLSTLPALLQGYFQNSLVSLKYIGIMLKIEFLLNEMSACYILNSKCSFMLSLKKLYH